MILWFCCKVDIGLYLYTILLLLPKWYGVWVWHTKEKPGTRGRTLRKSRAIVLQSCECEQWSWAVQYQDGGLLQGSFGLFAVNEYLVKRPKMIVIIGIDESIQGQGLHGYGYMRYL